jgi:UDP-N-acetylglucosamine/UDP-N-acetylgalactosamine diphosphorylase
MRDVAAAYSHYKDVLAAVGQDHLLRFWDALNEAERGALLNDLAAVDFDQCQVLIEQYVRQKPELELPEHIVPPEILPSAADTKRAAQYRAARERGEAALRAGEVAAFVVAGGQGTRLGFDGPKGAFRISPIRRAPLFQLFAEYLRGVERAYGKLPPWYIMTSPVNDADTRSVFKEHDFFGLPAGEVFFFQQGQMPAFSPDGKLLLAEKHRLALSPDGHGGSLTALEKSGALAEMRTRGIEHISYFQVDNPLVRVVDPLFVGLHATTGSDMSSKAITKVHDKEKVGNFCLADGKLVVIEYSDLPDELAEAKEASGKRKFDAGSIAIHVIARAFVERLTAQNSDVQLPWHRAEKKVPYVDAEGRRVEPKEPNAVKLEMFVFDALPLARDPLVMYTERAEEFSPVKNAEGTDSAETAERDMIRRAANWLESCGVDVPRTEDDEPAARIEISPAFAIDAEDLRRQLKERPTLEAGKPLLLD